MVFTIGVCILVLGLILGFSLLGHESEPVWPWVFAFMGFMVVFVAVVVPTPGTDYTTDGTQVSAPEWTWEYEIVPDREGIYGHATSDGLVVITEDGSGVPHTTTYGKYKITDSSENKLLIKTQYAPNDQRWVPWHTDFISYVEIQIDTDKVEAR